MIGPLNGWNGNKKHKYMFVHIAEQITVIHIDQVLWSRQFFSSFSIRWYQSFLIAFTWNKQNNPFSYISLVIHLSPKEQTIILIVYFYVILYIYHVIYYKHALKAANCSTSYLNIVDCSFLQIICTIFVSLSRWGYTRGIV